MNLKRIESKIGLLAGWIFFKGPLLYLCIVLTVGFPIVIVYSSYKESIWYLFIGIPLALLSIFVLAFMTAVVIDEFIRQR